MDPFSSSSTPNLFKWDHPSPSSPTSLLQVFDGYGVRYATVQRMGQLGFTPSTLLGMTETEVDDMMATIAHLFRGDLLLGERYGIKAALRAERQRRIESLLLHHAAANNQNDNQNANSSHSRSHSHSHNGLSLQPHLVNGVAVADNINNNNALDALSQEGLSEEPVQQRQLEKEAVGSGGEATGNNNNNKGQRRCNSKGKKKKKNRKGREEMEDSEDEGDSSSDYSGASERSGGLVVRQREHPFIVTEPGEVARAKKNGLDYLFHLYEQCRHFLLQVQGVAKEQGQKCPTKVTNQVFRYAKKVGASYINKPKMRHYVHCYALHCLDEEASNALRRAFKERGENVGAWRLACYKPLVAVSARHGWDIDAVFNAHPRLCIWYVPTKLRQLCHLARSNANASNNANAASTSVLTGTSDGLPPPSAMF